MNRRLAFAGIALAAGVLAMGAFAFAPEENAEDFDYLWRTLDREYAYFGSRQVDWPKVREIHRPKAAAAADRAQLVGALEKALETLTDSHLHLGTNTPSSTRLVPSGLDVWAEWRGARAIVTQVRAGYAAEAEGVRAGDEILAINGTPVAERVRARIPCCLRRVDEAVRNWALRTELAGTHDADRVLALRRRDGSRYEVHLARTFRAAAEENVSFRALEGHLGYIRVTNLGDAASVAAFDAALEALKDTRGLVLDLTETAAGGSTDVAEPILGRFFERDMLYQQGRPRIGEPWRRSVAPRGPWTYGGKLVVLVGRWTASMGEGMAIGLDGTRRATVVGTRMAGLEGAVFTGTLPRSGIRFNYPAERLLHVNGTPRESFRPALVVDLEKLPPERQATALLDAGVAALR
jgi:C-terminal processing protease CtpA/Prc